MITTPIGSQRAMNSISLWAEADAVTAGRTDIFYRQAPYPYSNRQDAPVSATAPAVWQVYPNPASDYVAITDPAAAGVASGYIVSDILGQTLLQGALAPGSNEVDLSSLKPGNYILQLHRTDGAGENRMFVKQ